MKHSCGAILYSYNPFNGQIGIILGLEGKHWLPFKGCNNKNETYEQAAIREIYEETCGIIKLKNIKLNHKFNSKNKHYHIGLVYVDYNLIRQFPKIRSTMIKNDFKEKQKIRFFPLSFFKKRKTKIHKLTMESINFYWNDLIHLSKKKII